MATETVLRVTEIDLKNKTVTLSEVFDPPVTPGEAVFTITATGQVLRMGEN